jgi:hypothetical protein
MDGFAQLIADVITGAGAPGATVHRKSRVDLPGYFRPTKEWDILAVHENRLLVAVEAKAQVGPSFGNNFNNRVEEALGSSTDMWTAFREGAFQPAPKPWLGYLMLLEDCETSRRPVRVRESHFPVLPEFRDASYAQRYETFCLKLLRERQYDGVALLLSDRRGGPDGAYSEPRPELGFARFARALGAHVSACSDD